MYVSTSEISNGVSWYRNQDLFIVVVRGGFVELLLSPRKRASSEIEKQIKRHGEERRAAQEAGPTGCTTERLLLCPSGESEHG